MALVRGGPPPDEAVRRRSAGLGCATAVGLHRFVLVSPEFRPPRRSGGGGQLSRRQPDHARSFCVASPFQTQPDASTGCKQDHRDCKKPRHRHQRPVGGEQPGRSGPRAGQDRGRGRRAGTAGSPANIHLQDPLRAGDRGRPAAVLVSRLSHPHEVGVRHDRRSLRGVPCRVRTPRPPRRRPVVLPQPRSPYQAKGGPGLHRRA